MGDFTLSEELDDGIKKEVWGGEKGEETVGDT